MSEPDPKSRRGAAGWAWYAATYWVRRPFRDLRGSAGGIGEQVGRYRQWRADRAAASQARAEDYDRRNAGLSPAERFAAEVLRHGWSQAELKQQERAARIARRACLVTAVLGFAAALVLMYFAAGLLVLAFAVLAIALIAGCVALAVRNAWWEFELQGRVLIPLADFISRPDLFRRLFS